MVKKTSFGFGVSPRLSFKFWDVWQFIKGRKKTAITIVAATLSYFVTDSSTVALTSGAVIEMIWALVEYYIREVPENK